LASKEDQTIFYPDCVPDGFVLSDPDHLKAVQIEAIIQTLAPTSTEETPSLHCPQRWPSTPGIGSKSAKAKGKRKMDYQELSSDDEGVELEGEDSQSEQKEELWEEGGQAEENWEEEGSEAGDHVLDREENDGRKLLKFGPPISKSKDKQLVRAGENQAGPSNRKPRTVKEAEPSAKHPNSKKRKVEEDLPRVQPLKISRTEEKRKSQRQKVRIEDSQVVSDFQQSWK
jgi:hypothetical protein